jgi:hypothetical protein
LHDGKILLQLLPSKAAAWEKYSVH